MTEGTAFDDSLKRLYEKPLRLTLFAASMRILFKHLMDTLAPRLDASLRLVQIGTEPLTNRHQQTYATGCSALELAAFQGRFA